MEENQEEQPSVVLSETIDSHDHVINLLSSEPLLNNDKVVAEATFLALLSMAQRALSPQTEDSAFCSWDCVKTPTEETTLGCASLNIQLPCESESYQFYRGFCTFLQDICPVVASIDVTRESLNSGTGLQAPSKDSKGRLVPSLLQLPKGATILIHIGNMSEGSLSPKGQETLSALRSLVQRHVVHYTFGAAVTKYPFEADYRVIVVSATNHQNRIGQDENVNCRNKSAVSRSKLLPCTMQVRLSLGGGKFDTVNSNGDSASRHMIRQFLACRRCSIEDSAAEPGGANNISLSATMLEVAQKEFLQRRSSARKTGSGDCTLVQEADFHRWLTMTRLEARSRLFQDHASRDTNRKEAIRQDWFRALALDDAIMAGR